MTKLGAWILAIRVNTLIASISPVLIGSALAWKGDLFSFSLFFSTILFAILVQIGTNISNDYFDCLKGADTQQRKGPIRVCQAKLLSLEEVRMGFVLSFTAAFFIALMLSMQIGFWLLNLGMISIALGILYTASPYALGYLGLGDVFVLTFFGPVASGVSYFIQTGSFTGESFVLGLGPGLTSCALLVVNNLRDAQEDALVGKKTLVVRFGKPFGQIEYTLCVTLPCFLPIFFTPLFLVAGLPLFVFSLSLVYKAHQNPILYNQLLIKTCYFLWAYTLVLILWIILG
ncbi:MAG: 1,4-dihydroxy-2-naphthoate octaprenyltransferase [Chlamydiota bacterium]